jgi:hypothetical protein
MVLGMEQAQYGVESDSWIVHNTGEVPLQEIFGMQNINLLAYIFFAGVSIWKLLASEMLMLYGW